MVSGKEKRIGIFGGTFNPVHSGHLKMAELARKEYKLSCVYFIPCGIPPHKQEGSILSAKLRYSLLKKAIKGKRYFKVLDIELKKKRKAYTIETIRELKTNKHSALYFLIGADEFEKLATWCKANELARLVTFLVLPRFSRAVKIPKVKNLKWFLVHTSPINVSSSAIRKRVKEEKSIKGLVPRHLHKLLSF